ncbi:hypothetical protein SRB521_00845 [Intestinimonas butyriciproducens]|nr:hypothetical protein SRB521_00845 [Intestinimonas butyriciproducens]
MGRPRVHRTRGLPMLFLPILTVDNAAINIVWYFCPESLFYKFGQML